MYEVEYYEKYGEERGKKLAVGMRAAQKDHYFYNAQTAIGLGANPEHARKVEEAMKRKMTKDASGFLYVIDNGTAEMLGYVMELTIAGMVREDKETVFFLNDPAGE